MNVETYDLDINKLKISRISKRLFISQEMVIVHCNVIYSPDPYHQKSEKPILVGLYSDKYNYKIVYTRAKALEFVKGNINGKRPICTKFDNDILQCDNCEIVYFFNTHNPHAYNDMSFYRWVETRDNKNDAIKFNLWECKQILKQNYLYNV